MTRRGCGLIVGLIVAVCTRTIMAQCNTVDAVTTASFKITGGQACSTFTKLNWTFSKSNGTLIIKWGTSTSYGTQKSVYASNPINITDLTTSTKYYYAVDGTFAGQTHQYTRSSFTTSSSGTVAVADRVAGENGIATIKLGNIDFSVRAKEGETVAIELFSLDGTAIGGRYPFSIKGGSGEIGALWNMSPGIYLARVSWRSGSMQQRVFISK
jgi:hypothetical protein